MCHIYSVEAQVLVVTFQKCEIEMRNQMRWDVSTLNLPNGRYCKVSINSSVMGHGGYLNLALVMGHREVLTKGPNVTLDHMWYLLAFVLIDI
jgi:hypothetical protein